MDHVLPTRKDSEMTIKAKYLFGAFFWVIWLTFLGFGLVVQWSDFAYGGEGPQNKLTDVPAGYKLVKADAECKDKDPCEQYKKEIAKLKAENERLRKDLKAEQFQNVCPKCEPKIIYKDKVRQVEVPVEKEKIVEKTVEKAYMKKNLFRVMGAIGQDGIETSASKTEPYAEDAETYYSGLGGLGYTRFLNDDFGLGVFGMFGANTSKMIGLSGEFVF